MKKKKKTQHKNPVITYSVPALCHQAFSVSNSVQDDCYSHLTDVETEGQRG